VRGERLGRKFGWLWSANAVSAFGSSLALGVFPLIAVRVLHASPAEVAALPASGLAVGAVLAVPLGPWVERRPKRLVMIGMDLIRFAAMASVPVAYAFGVLTFWQLLIVSVIAAAAKIAFTSASGAYLKSLVPREKLLVANGRFASTTWTVTSVGPPLGGAAISLLGPVVTVIADAVSYLLSAVGVLAIGGGNPRPEKTRDTSPSRLGDLLAGWRYILADPPLCLMLCNNVLVGGLILATEPLLAVLLLGQLKFTPWMYGMAFGLPCVGGLAGSWLSPWLVGRFGQQRVMTVAGTALACWPVGLAFAVPGLGGMTLVLVVQFGLVVCMGVFTPVTATYRLQRLADDRVSRVLAAWSITKNATIALLTGLWGVLATVTSPRVAIGAAGVLLLATPVLLPRGERARRPAPVVARS
jgi:MFS family permease